MKKIIILLIIPICIWVYEKMGRVISPCPEIPEPSNADEIAKVQKPLDQITGSFWTKNLDCRYLNPPKELTIINQAFDCETATQNHEILSSGCPYFRSQSTFDDGPIWCLVDKPSGKSKASEEYKSVYCK